MCTAKLSTDLDPPFALKELQDNDANLRHALHWRLAVAEHSNLRRCTFVSLISETALELDRQRRVVGFVVVERGGPLEVASGHARVADHTVNGGTGVFPDLLFLWVLRVFHKAAWVQRLLEQLECCGFPYLVHPVACSVRVPH